MTARGFRAAMALACAVVACVPGRTHAQAPTSAPSAQADTSVAARIPDSHGFDATVSVSGRRETLGVEDGRLATTLRLSGAVVVTGTEGNEALGKGFRADFIGFDDGSGTGTARAVWTDDAGDKIFSRMVGADMRAGRQSSATITGGTGRYAGIAGTYTFTWQYVMADEQGVVHVRAVSMKGRYRQGQPR